MNGIQNAHLLYIHTGEMVALVTLVLYLLFSVTITYHWVAFSPSHKATVKFLSAYYGISAVLFILMVFSLTYF